MASVSESQSYSNQAKRTQEAYEAERSQSRKNQEKELNKVKEDSQDQQAEAREEYNARIQAVREEANGEIRKLKEEMYDKNGKKFIQDARQLAEERNQVYEYKEQVDKDTQRRIQNTERATQKSGARLNSNEERKVTEALTAQKTQHMNETSELREQLHRYTNQPHDLDKEKAMARSEVIEKYESETLNDRDRIAEAYETRLNKVKQSGEEEKAHFGRRLNEVSADEGEKSAQQVQRQKQEFIKAEADRKTDAQRMEKYYQEQVKIEKDRNVRSESTLVNRNQESTDKAVAEKDKTYRDYIKQSSEVHSQELSDRDQKISDLKTTKDPLKVSPFVIQKIQNDSEERSHSALTKAQDTHETNLQAVQKRDQAERRELQGEYQQKYMNAGREQQRSRDIETKQFVTGFQDLQKAKTEEQMKMRDQFSQQRERTTVQHAQAMNLQQRKFQDDMTVQRDSLHEEKTQLQDDLEKQQKGQDRNWSTRIGSIHRDYEKKLLDTQDQSEALINEIKYSFDKKLRDQDRLSKKALEDRVKSYEHQIAQQTEAFKDRERFLTEQYQTELDTLKRTNARIIQKKS